MPDCIAEAPDVYTLVWDALEIAEQKLPSEADSDVLDKEAIRQLRGAIDLLEGRDPFEKKPKGKSKGPPTLDWEKLVGTFADGPTLDRLIRDVRFERIRSRPRPNKLAPLVLSCRKVLDPLLDATLGSASEKNCEDRRREYAEQLASIVRKKEKPGIGGAGVRAGRGYYLAYVTPDRA